MTVNELWERILDEMRTHCGVGQVTMDDLLSQLTPLTDDGKRIRLSYPEGFMISWVELNYADSMAHAAARVLHAARDIEFVSEGEAEQNPILPEQTLPAPKAKKTISRRKPLNTGLNTDYTFDSFVEGSSNSFAYAAARAVAYSADAPKLLFIHGESGLGKTHLLQAIGNAICERDEATQVLYLTSETFMNDYIDAISRKGDAINTFRRKYRKADVLLIDDVQFLARAGKTQEEFFHTFNALFASGKRIVLSADCPAGAITSMDERLVTRFQQGLTVRLLAPDYETRMAILRRRLQQGRNRLISAELVNFLATNITGSVRTLEGALVQLTTFASFCSRPLTIADARAQLSDLLRKKRGSGLSIEDIQQRVAEEFNVRIAELNGRRRTADIAKARQVAMFLARKHTDRSLQDIGAAFGGRDHGTVLHAERTIAEQMSADSGLCEHIRRLTAALA